MDWDSPLRRREVFCKCPPIGNDSPAGPSRRAGRVCISLCSCFTNYPRSVNRTPRMPFNVATLHARTLAQRLLTTMSVDFRGTPQYHRTARTSAWETSLANECERPRMDRSRRHPQGIHDRATIASAPMPLSQSVAANIPKRSIETTSLDARQPVPKSDSTVVHLSSCPNTEALSRSHYATGIRARYQNRTSSLVEP